MNGKTETDHSRPQYKSSAIGIHASQIYLIQNVCNDHISNIIMVVQSKEGR